MERDLRARLVGRAGRPPTAPACPEVTLHQCGKAPTSVEIVCAKAASSSTGVRLVSARRRLSLIRFFRCARLQRRGVHRSAGASLRYHAQDFAPARQEEQQVDQQDSGASAAIATTCATTRQSGALTPCSQRKKSWSLSVRRLRILCAEGRWNTRVRRYAPTSPESRDVRASLSTTPGKRTSDGTSNQGQASISPSTGVSMKPGLAPRR